MIDIWQDHGGSLDFRRDIFVLWKSSENETHSCNGGI